MPATPAVPVVPILLMRVVRALVSLYQTALGHGVGMSVDYEIIRAQDPPRGYLVLQGLRVYSLQVYLVNNDASTAQNSHGVRKTYRSLTLIVNRPPFNRIRLSLSFSIIDATVSENLVSLASSSPLPFSVSRSSFSESFQLCQLRASTGTTTLIHMHRFLMRRITKVDSQAQNIDKKAD